MNTLLVLRHAKSAWDTGDVDHERPLNGRGRRQGFAAGEYLAAHHPRVDRVLCSTSRRTRQTLQRAIDGGLVAGEITFHEEIYEAGVVDILSLLRELPDDVRTALVVGHWPGVELLVSRLARSGAVERFVTSAVATLEFDVAWADLAAGVARLTDYVAPGRE